MKTKLYEVVLMCDLENRRCLATESLEDPDKLDVLYSPKFFVRDPWRSVSRECVLIVRVVGTVTRGSDWVEGINYR